MIFNNTTSYIDLELRKTLSQYYDFQQVDMFTLSSGMNNITRTIKHNNTLYNARIYCNHGEKAKVLFEHEVLTKLIEQQLTIDIPIPVITNQGSTVAALADGRLVSLYKFIEGEQQASQELYVSLLQASGHLSIALAKLEIQMSEAYSPYYDLKDNYPSYTSDFLSQLALQSNWDESLTEKLLFLNQSRLTLEEKRALFVTLPHQYIHGDINFSNAVVRDNRVIAILDFEFVTYDLRAMELAVLLTEYFKISPTVDKQTFGQYVDIFQSVQPLTKEELEALPSLVQLRAVDVAMHFITRFVDGLDSLEVLKKIVEESYNVVIQINNISRL